MGTDRIHRATSPDGTTIAGRIHGQGPPLVLVPGGPVDGETCWSLLLPLLSQHYTCFALNTRGRSLSEDHPDHSQERLVQDVVAFVESIGDEVVLFGHSAGGVHALEATARTAALRTLALYEPTLTELADEELMARMDSALHRVGRAADEGRLSDAAQVFLEEVAQATDDELAVAAQTRAVDGMAPLVPVVLDEVAQAGAPHLSDHGLLARITVPVLILYGGRSWPLFRTVARYLQERLADARVRELPRATHLAPEFAPGPVAAELIQLLDEVSPTAAGLTEARPEQAAPSRRAASSWT
jgi:pimeloyl-ACP methyl ester carboxylesterase